MRSATKPIVLVLFMSLLLAAQLRERRIDFENEETGKPPRFFTTAVTGDKAEGKWLVEDVEGAPSGKKVLTQRDGKADEDRYALCLYDTDKVADIDIEVQLKSLTGDTDRCGGLVVRALDRNNYYVARADALDDDVRLYAVVQGKRTQIASQPVVVDKNKWHKLRMAIQGRHFQVYFNDVMLFEADDDAFRDPGNFGVWTSADSVTQFDDLLIKQVQQQQPPRK
jgi:hypothetical protein